MFYEQKYWNYSNQQINNLEKNALVYFSIIFAGTFALNNCTKDTQKFNKFYTYIFKQCGKLDL